MFAKPRVLSLITTRRCTAACDHCCVGAGPNAAEAIPVERMHSLIDEARRLPSFQRVVFTGGECFLLGKRLDALIAHAHRVGFSTRVVTNGYWAVSERSATARAQQLKRAGLDEMMLSTGTFHQNFVPVDRVVYAARSVAAAGVAVRIAVEDCDQSSFDDESLRSALAAELAGRKVVVSREPWIEDAGGRGTATLSHRRYLANAGRSANRRCAQVLDTVTVTPQQVVVGCCGFPLEQLPRLRIGSVADRPLDEVLLESPNELIKMWLHVAGPWGIANFVAKYVPDYSLPNFASICEACVRLQRDRRAMAVVVEHASEVVQSVAEEFARLQSATHFINAS